VSLDPDLVAEFEKKGAKRGLGYQFQERELGCW